MKLGSIRKVDLISEMEFLKVEMDALAETMKRTGDETVMAHGNELKDASNVLQTWINGLSNGSHTR